MKQKFIDAHMKVAEIYANLSSAKRLKVGAVLVKENRILSIGYNGTPSGWDNECEYEVDIYNDQYEVNGTKLVTKQCTIHAESNALLKCAADGQSTRDSVMFVTHSPCIECSKLIHQAKVKEVYYKHEYRNDDGLKFLNTCGITTIKVETNEENTNLLS